MDPVRKIVLLATGLMRSYAEHYNLSRGLEGYEALYYEPWRCSPYYDLAIPAIIDKIDRTRALLHMLECVIRIRWVALQRDHPSG